MKHVSFEREELLELVELEIELQLVLGYPSKRRSDQAPIDCRSPSDPY